MLEKEYILSFDISTSVIGISLIGTDDRLVELNHVTFPKPSKKRPKLSIYQKADLFKEVIHSYTNFNIKHIFIEEPLKNSPNINTVVVLAQFNGIISNILYEIFNIEPEHITVYEARKIFFPEYIIQVNKKGKIEDTLSFPKDCDKKQLVFEKVSWLEPQINWVYSKYFKLEVESYDRADAYVVGKAGLLKNGYIDSIPYMNL